MRPPDEVQASAPGKVILFGEHAVVYGEPSLSLALDKRIRVRARAGDHHTVNGQDLDPRRHAYIQQALRRHWKNGGVHVRTRSELPSASGVGSSAALSVATVAAVLRLRHGKTPPLRDVARAAFDTELATQGAASPNDTTISTVGGAILLTPERSPEGEYLWRTERNGKTWNAHRLDAPSLPLVVASTGTRGRTAEQVEKVRRFVEGNASARDVIHEIGQIALEGVRALRQNDLTELGALMDRNHERLHTLGVDTPQLGKLVEAARRVRGVYGAKLTGAGGGGSIVVLAEDPRSVQVALEPLAARVFPATVSPTGVEVAP